MSALVAKGLAAVGGTVAEAVASQHIRASRGGDMSIKIEIAALVGALLTLAALPAHAGDTVYGYDAQGQLTSVGRTAGSATYAYDKAGNRMQITAGAGSTQSVSSLQAGAKSTTTSATTTNTSTAFVLPQLLPENAAALSQPSSSSKATNQ